MVQKRMFSHDRLGVGEARYVWLKLSNPNLYKKYWFCLQRCRAA